MREQEIEVKSKLVLNDLKLDMNREITIYCSDDEDDVKTIKIANVEGKIVVFGDEDLDIELNKWQGIVPYEKRVRDIKETILT